MSSLDRRRRCWCAVPSPSRALIHPRIEIGCRKTAFFNSLLGVFGLRAPGGQAPVSDELHDIRQIT